MGKKMIYDYNLDKYVYEDLDFKVIDEQISLATTEKEKEWLVMKRKAMLESNPK